MLKKIKTLSYVLIILCLSIEILAEKGLALGVPAGTVITNVKDYIGSIYISSNYNPSLEGELFARWTNEKGKTNLWNGKYFYSSGILMTNNSSVTIVSSYDLSYIPYSYSHSGKVGSSVNFIYYITNKGNSSDTFTLDFSKLSFNDVNWANSSLSLFINDSLIKESKNIITHKVSNVSPDEVLKITLRESIPLNVANNSTNLIRFTIFNSGYNTNTKTGDNWPGIGAIAPAVTDISNKRDYQVSYITTRATGIYHYLSVTSANDMIHTIYNFDGSAMLANTEIKINILLESKPLDSNSFYLYYSVNSIPAINNNKIKVYGNELNYYAIIPNSVLKDIKNISSFNFILSIDNETYYRNSPAGNNYWSFKIKPMQQQRNNVNILCNLLNPTKGEKSILIYTLDKPSKVKIEIYSLSGEKIRTLFNGDETGGSVRKIYWDGKNDYGNIVSEGLYFISFRTDEFNELKKVVVIK